MSSASSLSKAEPPPGAIACHRRGTCRLCGGGELELVLGLAPTPPANAFVAEEAVGAPQQVFPLDVFLCKDCFHLQLLDVVDPAHLFENYVYVSGTSPVFVDHFRRYADDVIDRMAPPEGGLVVDIGSNDGTLLGFFKERGRRVLGIDPARDVAATANAKGIESLVGFFTPERARAILDSHGPASVITANNVFAHADDLAGIVAGVRHLLEPGGVFVLEVSYLVDVYRKTLFDTIYHEHLAYHSVKPLRAFLVQAGMEMIEGLRVDSHGGSLRAIAQHAGGPRPVGDSVAELTALEDELGLDRVATWKDFAKRIGSLRDELGSLIGGLKAAGKTVAGYGAPAKATTLMHHFGLGPDVIDFIVDDSPLKQGLYTPGHHIAVLPPTAIEERRPDYLLILAWNFAGPIMRKQAAYKAGGGHFIAPLPTIEVH